MEPFRVESAAGEMQRSTGGQLPLQPHQNGGPLPGNVEKFPEYCLHSHGGSGVTGAASSTPTGLPLHLTNGRPPSLSLQSVASSDSSDRDTAFDSRRSSIISTVSSYSYLSQNQSQSNSPQPPLTRSRRDAKQLQAARIQRVGSNSIPVPARKEGSPTGPKIRRFVRSGSQPADALSATEPAHEQGLTRMAWAEQQRWITVQQKTFTKWLNTKLEARELEVKDLVEDLSDGVCQTPWRICDNDARVLAIWNKRSC